jgi:hypothetical protein
LPTSPAWWWPRTPAAVQPQPRFQNFTVTYDAEPLPEIPQNLLAFTPPQPKLSLAAWALVISVFISLALGGWLLARWWQIARIVCRAATAENFSTALSEAWRLAGAPVSDPARWAINSKHAESEFGAPKVGLKIVAGRMSPAVCGLFCPVILLPRTLAENLPAPQLQAVLLHEIFHLRRRDVWVNLLQSLLQIIYWWQPLVWLANARIRRVREEAVDDAVMLALRDDAESYAPTLLAVAKLALNRPLASLGLVGILESRSALRQRIERLLDFRAPKTAGLTFASLLAICAFSAVALPMGEGPAVEHPANDGAVLLEPTNAVMSSGRGENKIVLPAMSAPVVLQNSNVPQVLIQAEIYRMRQADFEKLVSDPTFAATRQDKVKNFQQFKRLVKSSGFQPISRPRIVTNDDMPARIYMGNETNSIEFECRPAMTNGLIDLTSRIKIISTMANVTITNELNNQATLENGGGHVFSIKSPGDSSRSNVVVMAIGVQIVADESQFQQPLQGLAKRPSGESGAGDANNLLRGGKLLYEMGKLDEAEVKLNQAVNLDTNNATAYYYLNLVKQAQFQRALANNHTNLIAHAQGTTNGRATNKPVYTGPGRQSIINKLDHIRLDNVSFDNLPLSEVLRILAKQSKLRDPQHEGINFLINPNPDKPGQTIDPATGLLLTPTPADTNSEPVDVGGFIVNIPNFTNVRLADVLDAIVVTCDHPIKYSIQDFAVVFSVKGPETPQLFSRVFKVEPNVFYRFLENFNTQNLKSLQTNSNPHTIDLGDGRYITTINPASNVSEAARKFFTAIGVNLDAPPGKSVFYNDRLGKLFVKATAEDLGMIEHALSVIEQTVPQTQVTATNSLSSADGKTAPGVLTDSNFVAATRVFDNFSTSFPAPFHPEATGVADAVATNAVSLYNRTFWVNPQTFYADLKRTGVGSDADTNAAADTAALARKYFESLGVNLESPPGKAFFMATSGATYL